MFKKEAKINVVFLLAPVLIGLVAALVAPRFLSRSHNRPQSREKTQVLIEALSTALDTYKSDVGDYPTTEQGLEALLARPEGVSRWDGPYLKREMFDAWQRPFVYRYPGRTAGRPDLISYGADGEPGGEGLNAGISLP
jgi:general secretion pathway protein G